MMTIVRITLLSACMVSSNPPSDISIDGDTNVAFTENVELRFQAYGWQVLHVDDGDKWVDLVV